MPVSVHSSQGRTCTRPVNNATSPVRLQADEAHLKAVIKEAEELKKEQFKRSQRWGTHELRVRERGGRGACLQVCVGLFAALRPPSLHAQRTGGTFSWRGRYMGWTLVPPALGSLPWRGCRVMHMQCVCVCLYVCVCVCAPVLVCACSGVWMWLVVWPRISKKNAVS